MMDNFDSWNDVKKRVNSREREIYFYEREVWWANWGKNVGHEQNGKNSQFKRPLLIFRKFNPNLFFGIPLTTQDKEGHFYFPIEIEGKTNCVILSQLRAFSEKRLVNKITKIDSAVFAKLVEKFKKIALPEGNAFSSPPKRTGEFGKPKPFM